MLFGMGEPKYVGLISLDPFELNCRKAISSRLEKTEADKDLVQKVLRFLFFLAYMTA
jgi:hypothetical protein